MNSENPPEDMLGDDRVAIIGYAGRFPGRADADAMWARILEGEELIERWAPEALETVPLLSPDPTDPRFVAAGAHMPDRFEFDHEAFGLTPGQAARMDPQLRMLMQCVWHALESGGCDPERIDGRVSVYGGMEPSQFATLASLAEADEGLARGTAATRIAYAFGFAGEAIELDTACSTSLVAAHLAVQSLVSGQSDVSLVMASTAAVFQRDGYLYKEGSILSPDGRCRPFDEAAAGTVAGCGVVCFVLKLLDRALEDGNPVHAVIRGSAVNNDASDKVGFTAPSVGGQAAVIAEALQVAGVSPGDVTYVETHGTGTKLGDPIEVRALASVFSRGPEPARRCGIGSLKGNLGHMGVAAGAGGMLKAALCARDRVIPPSLHFRTANPALGLDETPFYVVGEREELPEASHVIAGVSSFGIGGTNAHLVLESPPTRPVGGEGRAPVLVPFSARSAAALEELGGALQRYFSERPGGVAEAARTLAFGRRHCELRSFVVAASSTEASARLQRTGNKHRRAVGEPRVGFMFTGQGVDVVSWASSLLASDVGIDRHLDRAIDEAVRAGATTLSGLRDGSVDEDTRQDPRFVLPALAVTQAAVVSWLEERGVRPALCVGHSFGDYVAAHCAGAIDLASLCRVAVVRGELMSKMPPGLMLVAAGAPERVEGMLVPGAHLACENASERCTVSGSEEAIDAMEDVLSREGIRCARLPTRQAFHSPDVDTIRPALEAFMAGVSFEDPRVPLVSSATGDVVGASELGDPSYWGRQMRERVRFSAALDTVRERRCSSLVEIGPGRDLAGLAAAHYRRRDDSPAVTSVGNARGRGDGVRALEVVGELWASGVAVSWSSLFEGEGLLLHDVPRYPFQPHVHDPRGALLEGLGQRLAALGATSLSFRGDARSGAAEVSPSPRSLEPSAVETRVVELFATRLGVEHVGVDDDFFELGGSSLDASQLVAAVFSELGVQLAIQDIFDHPTPRTLAGAIRPTSTDPADTAALEGVLDQLESMDPEELEGLDADQIAALLDAHDDGSEGEG